MADRKTVAQELAAKGGHDWETLSPEMVSAYLHNADLVIEERDKSPVDELDPKPVYTCDRCQDQAYIGGKRCLECNPIGLPVEQVHPKADKPTLLIIPKAIEGKTIGETADVAREIIEAKAKAALEAEEAKRTRPLKPNEYRCSKCSKPGKTIIHMLKKGGKGIGHKHQEFSATND